MMHPTTKKTKGTGGCYSPPYTKSRRVHLARPHSCITSLVRQSLRHAYSVARHEELARPGLHLRLEARELCRHLLPLNGLEKVVQLLARLLLRRQCNLQGAVQELANLLEVSLLEAARRHGRGADAHATGRHGGDIAVYRVLVAGDVHLL